MRLPILIALVLLPPALHAEPAPSVLVTTIALQQQAITDDITGYGVLAPDPNAVVNVTFGRGGVVDQVDAMAGQQVAAGAPILTLGADAAGMLAYQQAVDDLNFQRGEVRRLESLLAQHLATQSQLAAAQKAAQDADAAVKAQQRLGNDQRVATVTAPFAGVITNLAVSKGDRVQPGTAVAQLAPADSLRIMIGVEPDLRGKVKPGMPVQLVPVFEPRPPIVAQIDEIGALLNPQTQLVDVVVHLRGDAARGLLAGTRMRGSITVATRQGWVVPRQAVLSDAKGAYVYQRDGDKARRVDVTTGIEHADAVEIDGPLDPKQHIVAVGNYELQDGMPIREDGAADAPASRQP